MKSEKRKTASRLFSMLLALALFITMMPFGVTAAFAADASEFQPALTITGPDGTVKEYTTVQDVIDAFGSGTDDSFGVALEGIYVKKLFKDIDENCVVTVETQDNWTGTLNASGKTVKELKDLKGILAFSEDGKAFDPTSDEVTPKGKPLYGGYFKFYVGKDADGNVLVDKWVNRITIKAASDEPAPEPEPEPAAVLSVTGAGLTKELSFSSIKELKNDEAIKPLTLENVVFHTLNSYGTEEDFTVTGVTIESLIRLAGIKSGYVIDSVTATADDGYSKTYTAAQVLNKDIQGNKAMFIWNENGEKVQKTALGQFKAGENNKGGWVKGNTITLSVTTKKVTKPGTPRVTLVSGRKRVTVKWKKVSGAEGYEIYRSVKKTKGFKRIKTITSGKTIKFINKSLKGRKTYYYKVRAYKKDANGKKVYGKYSVVKKVTTKR